MSFGLSQPDDAHGVEHATIEGEVIAYPGVWSFEFRKQGFVIVSDDELRMMAEDPDRVMDLSASQHKHEASLRQICEEGQRTGKHALSIAFDQFFAPYRPTENMTFERRPPNDPEYVSWIAAIAKFAQQYDMRLQMSLIHPIAAGPAFAEQTGETGRWYHYRKGIRDPKTGAFNLSLWQQQGWSIHLGTMPLKDAGVRVFAFSETPVDLTPYRSVDPDSIVEITPTAKVVVHEGLVLENEMGQRSQRITVSGEGMTDIGPLDRVLVVQVYETPEMDYFSPQALPYLKGLVDLYADAGVKFSGFYSDEPTIMGDTRYFNLHDHGEFAMRYMSPGMEKAFAQEFGEEYTDFAKYMLYFCYGQDDFNFNLDPKMRVQQTFGQTPEAVHETALFRARYYHMLQDHVVDLFTEAKHYAEERMGRKLLTRGHPTWAESPTIDIWDNGHHNGMSMRYDYTSNFMLSNTAHQAASACYDYFKWGEFMTGNGNDMAECGFLDRNYWGLSLASSTGIINELPHSYSAHWGMPAHLHRWRYELEMAFGVTPNLHGGKNMTGHVQNCQHRDVDVMILYPMDLVAVEERFGSWMTQYPYANYITQDMLLKHGAITEDGKLEVGGYAFNTLMASFEPFPRPELFEMIDTMLARGGRVIWSAMPPMLTREGTPALERWEEIFGVDFKHWPNIGDIAAGHPITFEGTLENVEPQIVLTHLLPDRIYPVTPREGVTPLARCRKQVVGSLKTYPSGGEAVFLGFRPRDDQSQSLGYDERHLFDILDAFGVYPPTGTFPGVQDNTEYLSRTSELLVCRYPNGALAFCPHLKTVEENWGGHWARDTEQDNAALANANVPTHLLDLSDYHANGHIVSYQGSFTMTLLPGKDGEVLAFSGNECQSITLDGKTTTFAEAPIDHIIWALVPEERRVSSGAELLINAQGTARLTLPRSLFPDGSFELVREGIIPGSKSTAVPFEIEGDKVCFVAPEDLGKSWIFAIPAAE